MKGITAAQIDWSQAPEGTTHCDTGFSPSDGRFWEKREGDSWSCWRGAAGWCSFRDDGDRRLSDRRVLARPTPWNGEGLPPVGTICIYQAGSRKPQKVHILAHAKHGSHDAVLMAKDQMGPGKMIGRIVNPENFSPILTPEEKVAREINDIQAVLKGADDDLDCAQRLVAAGYRKVEGGAQ